MRFISFSNSSIAISAKSTSKGILLIFRNLESNDKLSAGLSFTSLNAQIYGLHLTKKIIIILENGSYIKAFLLEKISILNINFQEYDTLLSNQYYLLSF
jgi:hypothetical protein